MKLIRDSANQDYYTEKKAGTPTACTNGDTMKQLLEQIKPGKIIKIGTGEYQSYQYPSELAKLWLDGEITNDEIPGNKRFSRIKGWGILLISPVVKPEFDIVEYKSRKDDADVFSNAEVKGIGDIIEPCEVEGYTPVPFTRKYTIKRISQILKDVGIACSTSEVETLLDAPESVRKAIFETASKELYRGPKMDLSDHLGLNMPESEPETDEAF